MQQTIWHGTETHCAHLLYLYVGDDSNFGMFRSTLDYYSRLVITNILPTFFSFPAQVCDVQIQRNATNFLISLTHSEWAIFIPPPLICRSSIIPSPTLKLKCPKHTLTPDFLVYGPSGEISVFAQQIELTFCFFPPPYLFNLSCCIYKGSFI